MACSVLLLFHVNNFFLMSITFFLVDMKKSSSPGLPAGRRAADVERDRRLAALVRRRGGSAKEIGVRGSAKNHNKRVCKESQ